MRKIFLLLFQLIAFSVSAQITHLHNPFAIGSPTRNDSTSKGLSVQDTLLVKGQVLLNGITSTTDTTNYKLVVIDPITKVLKRFPYWPISGGGGSGTVTSVADGYGIAGGTITTTGTLRLDSAEVSGYYWNKRDSLGILATIYDVGDTAQDNGVNKLVNGTNTTVTKTGHGSWRVDATSSGASPAGNSTWIQRKLNSTTFGADSSFWEIPNKEFCFCDSNAQAAGVVIGLYTNIEGTPRLTHYEGITNDIENRYWAIGDVSGALLELGNSIGLKITGAVSSANNATDKMMVIDTSNGKVGTRPIPTGGSGGAMTRQDILDTLKNNGDYIEYAVLLTQVSNNPPIPAPLGDTTTFSSIVSGLTFTYEGSGEYKCYRGDGNNWDITKTSVEIGSSNEGTMFVHTNVTVAKAFLITAGDPAIFIQTDRAPTGAGVDDALTNTILRIRIYN